MSALRPRNADKGQACDAISGNEMHALASLIHKPEVNLTRPGRAVCTPVASLWLDARFALPICGEVGGLCATEIISHVGAALS